jgi:hypothetical protein
MHATGVRTIPSAEKEPIAVTKLFSKIGWRILPFLIICYMIAFLDRINIGYAQLQMKQTLTFSDATYGFGAGIFFVGYFLFEVPSNLLLERIGVFAKPCCASCSHGALSRARWHSCRRQCNSMLPGFCSAYSKRASSPASSSI